MLSSARADKSLLAVWSGRANGDLFCVVHCYFFFGFAPLATRGAGGGVAAVGFSAR